MKPGFSTCDNKMHQGESNTWFTPKKIIQSLGEFDLDPCTQSKRPFDTAKNHFEFDQGDCGLEKQWFGRVWMNPPYGRDIGKWLDKMLMHGNGVALVFSRTDTRWAQKHMDYADGVLFVKGRIYFISENLKVETNGGSGSMLLAYGSENVKYLKNINGILF